MDYVKTEANRKILEPAANIHRCGGVLGRCFAEMNQRDFNEVAERKCRFVDMRTGHTGLILGGETNGGVNVKYDHCPNPSWLGGYMGDLYCLVL